MVDASLDRTFQCRPVRTFEGHSAQFRDQSSVFVGHLDMRFDRLAVTLRSRSTVATLHSFPSAGAEEPEGFHSQRHEQGYFCLVFVCALHGPGDDLETGVQQCRMQAVFWRFTAHGNRRFNQSQCFAGMAPDLFHSAKTSAKIQPPPFIIRIESFGSNFCRRLASASRNRLDRVVRICDAAQ